MAQSKSELRHGVLMRINSLGVLIVGAAKSGKSDLALELLERGHTLVADDVVQLRQDKNRILGSCPTLCQDYLSIADVGFINVRQLYGAKAIARTCAIEFIVQLTPPDRPYHPLGLQLRTETLLKLALPAFEFPMRQNRSHALLLEVALQHACAQRAQAPGFAERQRNVLMQAKQ